MNNKLVLVSITDEEYLNIIKVLLRLDIYYSELSIKNNKVYFKVNYDDYNNLKKYFINIKLEKRLGLDGIISFMKKHYIILISFIITYGLLLLLSNVIFDIEIVTNNNELKRIINLYLEENGIEKNKFMKSYEELEIIKKKILEENKDTIEWLEIERVGTKYIVSLTERVINDKEIETTKRDLVAKKDALILYLINKNGTSIKEVNELVKKGDIIITGDIIKNEEVVDRVDAKGEVYGEVWYTVNTTVPYKHIDYVNTGEIVNHIYLDIFGKKFTLMGKYDTKNEIVRTKVLLDKPYLFFKVVKEEKELYEYVTHTVTYEEAYEEALKRSERVINEKLSSDEYIIDKKVLKINKYSSKIEIEIFYKVYENIGEYRKVTSEVVN